MTSDSSDGGVAAAVAVLWNGADNPADVVAAVAAAEGAWDTAVVGGTDEAEGVQLPLERMSPLSEGVSCAPMLSTLLP